MLECSSFRVAGYAKRKFMSGLDIFFQNPKEFQHPMIRSWSQLLHDRGGTPSCEIERKREGLGFLRAKIYLHFDFPGGIRTTEQDDWDNELNRFLVERHVRAVSADNEQIRFALMLKEGLKKSEVRFGDGYFNSVLVELLATAFSDSVVVQDKLREIAASKPHQGRVYRECVEMIESAIAKCAQSLLKDLGYEQPLAEKILAGGVGYYLDERFSLLNRRLVGLG